jgi:hypothetical protein
MPNLRTREDLQTPKGVDAINLPFRRVPDNLLSQVAQVVGHIDRVLSERRQGYHVEGAFVG